MKFTRRNMLRGATGAALALPWLEQFDNAAHAQTPNRPRRVIVVTYQMGVPGAEWRPSTDGLLTLPYVTAPLEAFKNRCLFVSDIDNRVLSTGGNTFTFGHPGKSEGALTGSLLTGAFPVTNGNLLSEILAAPQTTGSANSESIEQRIGRSLLNGHPFSSVDLGIDGDTSSPYFQSLGRVSSRFSFESRATPVSLECNSTAAFNRYFANVVAGNPAAEAALLARKTRNKSVLDAVRGSFADLRRGLGADDQRRLDEHAARIRQIELTTGTAPGCAQPTGITQIQRPRMDQQSPLQIRLLAQAMACNLAPVGRLEFANQQNPRFGIQVLDDLLDSIPSGTPYDWHAMVHGDPVPGTTAYLRPGRDAAYTTFDSRLISGYRFFVQQFAALLAELDRFPEGTGTTVLDNSLVILASDLGEGMGHGMGKMGYVLAGNVGTARKGFHLRASPASANFYTDSTYNVNQLLHSILDMAGVTEPGGGPVTEFGLGGFLASLGAPRRIDALF